MHNKQNSTFMEWYSDLRIDLEFAKQVALACTISTSFSLCLAIEQRNNESTHIFGQSFVSSCLYLTAKRLLLYLPLGVSLTLLLLLTAWNSAEVYKMYDKYVQPRDILLI